MASVGHRSSCIGISVRTAGDVEIDGEVVAGAAAMVAIACIGSAVLASSVPATVAPRRPKLSHASGGALFMRKQTSSRQPQGARLGSRYNCMVAALGRQAQVEGADRFTQNVLPVIQAINRSGISTLAGIAEALNTGGLRASRGGKWYIPPAKAALARTVSDRLAF